MWIVVLYSICGLFGYLLCKYSNSLPRDPMIIHTRGISASTALDDYNKLACIYCTDNKTGYVLSLCCHPDDELAEVMVIDQQNYPTREVTVELTREQLSLRLSPAVAAELDNITEYIVPFKNFEDLEEQIQEIDAALTVIFGVGNRGEYIRRL